MGIEKVELYVCTCDNCGCDYEESDLYMVYPDKTEADDACRNNGDWIKYHGKYYCTDCYELDEEGDATINASRKNKFIEP